MSRAKSATSKTTRRFGLGDAARAEGAARALSGSPMTGAAGGYDAMATDLIKIVRRQVAAV